MSQKHLASLSPDELNAAAVCFIMQMRGTYISFLLVMFENPYLFTGSGKGTFRNFYGE